MKILIVDDNEKNRKLFRLIVKSMGHEAVTAVNGKDGVEAARKEKPHLILMDIQMPVMDGIAALKILKGDEETDRIPVIALTSYAMKGDEEKFLEAGFDAYISKPVDAKLFQETIRSILG